MSSDLLPGEAPPEAELHLVTGDENGLIKRTGFGPHAAKNSETWTKRQARELEITSMVWKNSATETELLLARRDGAVEVWDAQRHESSHQFRASGVAPVGVAFSKSTDSIVCCSNRGVVDIWSGTSQQDEASETPHKTFTIPTPAASEVLQMRLSPVQEHIFATGGKESPLKLFDINTQQRTFQAKNVPFSYLKLRVPIYIRDLQFVRSSPAACAGNTFEVVTVSSHKHVRLYDTRAQRRCVRSVEFGDNALRSVCVTPDQKSIIVADVVGRMTRLSMADFRQISVFKGAGGSVRSLTCHDELPLVASVGLDRCVRVHHLESRRIMQRTYLRSRLNCVLFQGHPDPDGEEVESYSALNSIDGARVIDEAVAGDKGMWRKLDRNTKVMEETIAKDRAEKMKRKVEVLQKKHGDPALRRHRFSLAGFISGDGMAAPMQVKGSLLVNKKTLKITGTYTTKKPSGNGWFDPGDLSGKVLEHGMMEVHTIKRGNTVSSLEGGVLSFDESQSLVRLVGKNLKNMRRIWKLRVVLQKPAAAAEPAGGGAAKKSRPSAKEDSARGNDEDTNDGTDDEDESGSEDAEEGDEDEEDDESGGDDGDSGDESEGSDDESDEESR